MESCRRDLFIDIVVDRFIIKKIPNNGVTLFHLHTPKQMWDHLKLGLVFIVYFILSCHHASNRILR